MALPNRIMTIALAVLSAAAGIPKLLQLPQELSFLGALGISGLVVSLLGVLQIIGGALLVLARYRTVGAILVGFGFLVSSLALLVGGNVAFGLISLVPIVVLVVVLIVGRRGNESVDK